MPMYLYIIVFYGILDPTQIGSFLNSRPEIRNWYQYGNSIAILSTCVLPEVQKLLMPLFFSQTFLVSPIYSATTGGNMPADFWKFVNNPQDSGFWPPLPPGNAATPLQG